MYFAYIDAFLYFEVFLFGQVGVDFHISDAQYGTLYGTVLFQVGDYLAYNRGRNGKGVAGIATSLGIDGGVDTYQFTGRIDQCTSTVTGIDCGIGLDKGFDAHLLAAGIECTDATGLGADNTGCHGRGQSQRVAYGQHPFAHFQIVRIAEFDSRQLFGVDFYQSQVGRGVGTDYTTVEGTVIIQGNIQFVGTFDHVVVGDDIAIRGNDDTRAQSGAGLRLDVTAALPEEIFK